MKSMMITILLLAGSFVWGGPHKVPTKYWDRQMTRPVRDGNRFSQNEIESGTYVKMKSQEWEACHQKQNATFALSRDSVQSFVETPSLIKKLGEMETAQLMKGKADRQPWSGDYWPYSAGLLAVRHFDRDFRNEPDWKTRYDYVHQNPLSSMLDRPNGWEQISPAEKYDVVFGSRDGQLTESMWQQGKVYFDQYGDVEGWMGICHGWAPAAIVEGRPVHQVSVPVADEDERQIVLNPSEIKGLVSYDWANNSYPSVLLGKRCEEQNPPVDENGRQTNPECFDLNPGTWHLAIVNRLGAKKKSFVMDATYDYQVWNQPVLEYSYTYFNPMNGVVSQKWQEAIVARSDWSQDPYRQYRSEQSRSIVGIKMKVAYVVESRVGPLTTDSESQDLIQWVTYEYDLELNQNNEVIGGEWHQDSHPDFIWTPRAGAQPVSRWDHLLIGNWEAMGPVPENWQQVSRMASPRGVILSKAVRAILKKSQRVF